MSPVEMPCKYSQGSATSRDFARRTYGHQARAEYRRLVGSRACLRNPNGDRPDPCQHLALRLKAVSHHRRTPVSGPLIGKACQKLIEFDLYGLGNQPLCTLAKYRAQKIPSLLWFAKFNYRILAHGGVTPCCLLKTIWTIAFQQVTPPSSTHFRTPDSVIALEITSERLVRP
jgi:hypothetical protein